MVLREIAPEIFCLEVSVKLSINKVNLYIFRGKVPTMIDTGTNDPEVYQAIQEALKELGIPRLEQVLLTHWHVDHAGGAESLRRDGARILSGTRDYEEWVNFSSGKSFKIYEAYADKVWGVPPEQLAIILEYNKRLTFFQPCRRESKRSTLVLLSRPVITPLKLYLHRAIPQGTFPTTKKTWDCSLQEILFYLMWSLIREHGWRMVN